jgi:hypothetical protein
MKALDVQFSPGSWYFLPLRPEHLPILRFPICDTNANSYIHSGKSITYLRGIFSIKFLLSSSRFFQPLLHQRHPPHHKIRKRNKQASSNYSIVCRGLPGCIPTHRASVMAPCLPSASPLLLWLTLVTHRAARSSQAHKSTLSFSTHGCQHQSLPSPQDSRIILLWWLFTHTVAICTTCGWFYLLTACLMTMLICQTTQGPASTGRDLGVRLVLYLRQHPWRETNKALSEYETEALQIEPTCPPPKFPEVFSTSTVRRAWYLLCLGPISFWDHRFNPQQGTG